MKKRKFIYCFIMTTMLLCGCSRQNTRVPDNSSVPESITPSATAETPHETESTEPSATTDQAHVTDSTEPSATTDQTHITESATAEANHTGTQSESGITLNPTGETAAISENDAKQIVLDQVPGASDQDIRVFKTDYDNGKLQYEGKIYFDQNEYEFEIDAYTGTILEWDVEPISNTSHP